MKNPGPIAAPAVRGQDRASTYHDLSIQYEGRTQDLPVRAPDLSPSGMFINTPQHFPEGAILKVSFRITRGNELIETRAEVRYCLEGVGVGVEFVDIAPESVEAIQREVDALKRIS